jgi:hypothetical protein
MHVGWWPGSGSFPRPAFYAYADPRPVGIEAADVVVPAAHWNADLGEFILHYDDVRVADDPAARARQFLDAAYHACATRAGWDPSLLG